MTRAPFLAQVGAWRWSVLALVCGIGLVARFVSIGADWDWLVAMGDHVRATGAVPDDVPFAAADTAGWHNVPVLAELVASALHDLGPRAAVLAHLALVCTALVTVAQAARVRGAGDGVVAVALSFAVLGGLATFGVVRAQTLSLVPFALVVGLVVSQARRPDRRIWWAVPLVVVWGNLHGAALLGVCVLGAYLVVGRLWQRPIETVAVGLASLAALCLTPQLWRTPVYYLEVFDNVSAQRGEGLWARPSLGMPFDVLMLLAAGVLLVLLLRSRRPAWEYVAVLGLCVATASAARHGTWLLLLLVALVGRTSDPVERHTGDRPSATSAVVAATFALVVALPVALVRGDAVLGAPPEVVEAVAEVAGDRVVLAPAPLSESLAVAGVDLWASNPLDAFTHDDQAAYLDFLDGVAGGAPAVEASDVVVVREDSVQEALVSADPDLEPRPCGDGWTCFERR